MHTRCIYIQLIIELKIKVFYDEVLKTPKIKVLSLKDNENKKGYATMSPIYI